MITPNKKSEKKRYVIYTRCSTDDQAQGEFTTLDAQAHHCKNMIDAFGYELANFGKKGVINDDGYSGKDLNRPGIQSILSQINKKRSFDGIIFFRLDRLTRNPRDLYSLIDLFRAKDVDFVSVRENLDSSTAIGRVVIGILGLLSAFERELTGERVKASAIARVRQGLRVGGKTPIGYKLIPNGDPLPNGKQPKKIIINDEVAPHIRIVWEMAADNRSLTQIAHELINRNIKTSNGKIWRRQGLSNIVKNPFYKGYLQYNGEIHKGQHEPLVDEKLWDKANRILSARLPGHNLTKVHREYNALLAGLIKCGSCGSHMVSVHSAGRGKRKFFYYECGRARQSLGCSNKRVSAIAFDRAIIDYFKRALKDQEIIIKAIGNAILDSQIKFENAEKKFQEMETKLNSLRHEARELLELALNGTIAQGTTYKTKMTTIESDISKLEEEIDKLQIQKKLAKMNAHSGEFLQGNIRFAMQYIDKAPPEAQRSLLRALIKDIIIYEDKIAINMFIDQPIEEALPSTIPQINPKNGKSLIPISNRDKASVPNKAESLANKAGVSTPCPVWGG